MVDRTKMKSRFKLKILSINFQKFQWNLEIKMCLQLAKYGKDYRILQVNRSLTNNFLKKSQNLLIQI